jgi:hypothetical protein
MSTNFPGRKRVEAAVRPVLLPIIAPIASRWAGHKVTRLLGFWLVWHTYGSISALVDAGMFPRQTVYRLRSEFVEVFGVNVEDFDPDLAAVIAGRRRVVAEVPR